MVPVAVRPAYCSQQTRPVKKLCPSLLLVLRGSRAPSTFLSCGTRLPCSLVDAVLSPSALFCIHRAHSRAWSTTPITPPNIGQSRHPVLPTSNFSLLLAVTVTVIVTATACCCCWCRCCARCLLVLQVSQGCQDCNVGPSSSCAATADLDVSALSHSYQHCPPVRRLSASLVFAAHLCVPNSCALKKEHKRVGRAHSPSINTLTAYIYPTVFEPSVSLAGVERVPPRHSNCRPLGYRVEPRPDHALVVDEQTGLRDTSLRVAPSFTSI